MAYFLAPNFYQIAPPAESYLVSSSVTGTQPSEVIPSEVQSALRSLMVSIPSLNFSRRNLISQVGPIKPERLDRPKSLPPVTLPIPTGELVNVIADRQEFNAKEQIFTASGNVTVTYRNSVLKGDVVKLNLLTKDTTAEGNVFLQRGEQKIRGALLSYNYGTAQGSLTNASGFINLNSLNSTQVNRLPLDSDLRSRSSIINVFGDAIPGSKDISRLGFTAEKLILDGDLWTAENLKVTNDPFSPPELELRASKATLTKISPTQDRLDAESPTLVFDQVFTLPVPINSLVFDQFERSFPAKIGFDRRDGGGFFYQQNFNPYTTSNINFQISPQLFLQRAFEGNILDANVLGLVAKLDAVLPDSQFLSGRATLSGLNLNNIQNGLRANIQYSRPIFGDYILVAEYAYRDRIFNGSLGFQDVQNSIGLNLFSPNYVLGDSQINLTYQFGTQYVGASGNFGNSQSIASLIKTQGATALTRSFPIWKGQPLPAEKELGLKYLPEPITPSVDIYLGAAANYAFYSSGNSQSFISGTVGVVGVFGNFSKPFLDYTKINISYTKGLLGGQSPFFFDRVADTQTINFGIVQQIYGPFRFGFDQSFNPATGKIVDSNYSLQYDRRTYAIVIRYNPNQEIGEVVFRISDFNWGDSNSNVTTVTGGLEQR